MKTRIMSVVALAIGLMFIADAAMPAAGNGPTPAAPTAQPAFDPKLPTLFIIGDSTVKNGRDNGAGGLWGWGNPIAAHFDRTKINVDNRGLGGTSSRTYQTNGLWDKVLAAVKPGDFVIMQFGHNDGGPLADGRARASLKGNGDETEEVTLQATGKKEVVHSYGWYMRKYIADTKAKGAIPIVCSPIPRNDWTAGKVNRTSNSYGKWAAEAAKQGGAYFIDLNEIIARHYEQIGQEKVTKEFFVSEHTHTTLAGAKLNAECVIEGLKALKDCPLISFLSPPADIDQLQCSFERPPDDARIMMRWWWFGPAVTKVEIERELKVMKEGGIGGVEVQPTYPLALDDEKTGIKNLKFLSPEFLDMLAFTAQKARELGMRMDLTLGSGWPYGGPQFSASEAAGRLRTQIARIDDSRRSVPVPELREGQKVFAAFLGPMKNVPAGDNPFNEVEIRDNAAQLPADLGGASQLTFFIAGRTGMKVKRPAFGAEGFVVDHYNPAAIGKFIQQIAELELRACGANLPYAVFCDSLEVGGEDWTDNFLAEFQKRRGYDLRPLLPALFNNIGPKTADIRHDWGKTITELFNDYFVRDLEKWAKKNGTRFRIQAYGTPPAALYSYAYADLPEGEGYQWKGFRETRWAASASHLLGRPITSSETWTWLHSPVFRASPLDMKAEADLHILQGVNQFIGHGWPYTAPGVEYPGWRFYASAVFDEKNPWWIVMPDVTKYLQRLSALMREGQPANDVALYLANSDAWASFTPGRVAMNAAVSARLGREIIPRILEAGYNLDFFDDGMLEMRGKVEGGTLAFGDLKFKVVVLAGVERIPPPTMRKLEEFARGGGILIATRSIPSLAPGFKATAEEQKTVQQIAQRLFKDPGASGIFLESESGFGAALAKRLPADVKFEPAAPEIGVVHRKTDAAEVYFLANTGNTRQNVKATFRVAGMQVESWNPITGRITAETTQRRAGGTSVAVELEPYGSQIFVLSSRTLPVRPAESSSTRLPQVIDLSRGWQVTFGNNSQPVALDKLSSWTDNERTRYFSGVATYEKKVTVPAEMLKEGLAVQLQFGQSKPTQSSRGRMQTYLDAPVREAAVVYINGKRAGSAWCPPYSVDVTSLLKSGENDLRIEVGNLAVNYMADLKRHPLPDYAALVARFGDRFQPQDMQLIQPVPAGLLGPIQLIASGAKKP